MIFIQHLHVHPGPVIIPFRKAPADDFHQVGISGIILRQQHQMVISVLPSGGLLIKPGVGRHINLAADYGFDPLRLRSPIEINHTIHHAVIRNGGTVHAQFFHPGNIFFYFVGTIQKRIFRVDMKMYKCHG